ncbi:MAG: hypothetical protein ACK5PQ_00875 [Alphaproteobacteria bacterium]
MICFLVFLFSATSFTLCVDAGGLEMSLLETAIAYRDSLEDDRTRCLNTISQLHQKDAREVSHESGSSIGTQTNVQLITDMFDGQCRMAEDVVSNAASLVSKKITLETFLKQRLLQRLFLLGKRSKKIADNMQWHIKNRTDHAAPVSKDSLGTSICAIIPTDESLLEFFEGAEEYALAEKERLLRLHQTLDWFILMAWRSLDRDQLSDETIGYIKMSPHLWAILEEKKSIENANPDHAGGFALLKFIYNALGREKIKKCDPSIARDRWYLACLRFSDPDPEQRTQLERNGVLEGLTDFQRSVDGELFNLYRENKIMTEDLPLPSFLGDRDKKAEADAWVAHLVKASPKKEKHGKKLKNNKTSKNKKRIPNEVLNKNEDKEYELAETEESEVTLDTKQSELKVLSLHETKDEEETTPRDGAAGGDFLEEKIEFDEKTLESILKNEISSSVESDFVYPLCARLHPEILEKALQPGVMKIKRKDQEFVNKLFDKSRLNSVSYQDFYQFWLSIGGAIARPGKGGSHLKLIAPDNTGLWGTFVPHGDGKYGPRVIQALRAAVWWLGLRPEEGV